ncbi:MAG: FkbM family methyltransferase [Thermodesulfobacteriota bacterium]
MMAKPLTRFFRPLLPRHLVYCDVGARGGVEAHPWRGLQPLIDTISFEPDEEEFRALARTLRDGDRLFNCAVHRQQGSMPLFLTKSRGCSSVYHPNRAFLRDFPETDRFEVEAEVQVRTERLDDFLSRQEVDRMDFVKIDVQGAGLDVLQGATELLSRHLLGVEIEVEFQPLYVGQPLFAAVDSFLAKGFGLQLFDLRKAYWKRREGVGLGQCKGQLIFGDALYLRPPEGVASLLEGLDEEEAEAKVAMACLIGLGYGYVDYVLALLDQGQVAARLPAGLRRELRRIALGYGTCLRYRSWGSRVVAEVAARVYRISQPSYHEWSASGHHLGSRKQFGMFY